MTNKNTKNKRFQIIWRYGLVTMGISVLALLIVTSLVRTTVVEAENWNKKADAQLTRVRRVQPTRGDILASDGSVLATNLTTYNVCIDYKTISMRNKTLDAFIAAVDSLSDSLAYYYPQRTKKQWKERLINPLKASPDKRPGSYSLLRGVTFSDYTRILGFPFFHNYPKQKNKHGLHYETRTVRAMPFGPMARRSIGCCKYLPENKYEGESKEKVEALHGYSGLECALDSLLYGTPGTARYTALTRGVRSWVDKPAVDGKTIQTTVDIKMQDIVENELHDMLVQTGAEWGTCVLMEVATGDIKAISNLERDKKSGEYIEAMNRALQRFEPGSVMKPISMIVALEDGYAYPLDKTYPIGHTYKYASGPEIHDTHSPSTLPVSQFIEYSSNIGMTRLITPHYSDNLNGFRDRLAELGFFDKFNTGMAGEKEPFFPDLENGKNGGRITLSRMTFGYATKISPLYICAVYNAIANNGRFVRPRMVKAVIDCNGNVTENPVSYVRDSICSQKNAKVLREMIHAVVHGKGGTAKSLRNDIVDIAGKTGTSRVAIELSKEERKNKKHHGGYKEGKYRLAFCGFFPYDKPKYTCMVLISEPRKEGGAATTSGTVVKNIALKLFARGMLDNKPSLAGKTSASALPVLYADATMPLKDAKNYLRCDNMKQMHSPADKNAGQVPDVTGMGMRNAIARIENAGYNVQVKGTGYACGQIPAAGTPAKKGTTVTINFRTK